LTLAWLYAFAGYATLRSHARYWLHGASRVRAGRFRMPAKKKQKQAAADGKAVKPKKKKTSRGK
jgi:hypothetical protein